ncbi:hypothetical protein B0H13DRAFT_1898157 [Mycena leptocephala]|nr:hypothetical protein B0H13DRAFT_1898157 [Mycena leptocephala]
MASAATFAASTTVAATLRAFVGLRTRIVVNYPCSLRRPAQRRKVPPAPPGTLPSCAPHAHAKMLELYEQALPHAYLAFTKSLAEVLHGVRLREQKCRILSFGRRADEGPQVCDAWAASRDLWDVDSVGAGRKNAESLTKVAKVANEGRENLYN